MGYTIINCYSQSAKDYFDTATKEGWSSYGTNFDKAILNLNKAIEINPMYAEAYYRRGHYKLEKARNINSHVWRNGSFQDDIDSLKKQEDLHLSAVKDFSKAIEIDNKKSYYYRSRGDEELLREDYNMMPPKIRTGS